ncbi:exodeoxyribonuclease V subunit alpha, partial [Rudaea sp.]|uniref:exodeoxyribonuclease V subunit alpha n=1 Tax=Rudaea sp. TaxID=2136325 RepID=UPI002ED36AA4
LAESLRAPGLPANDTVRAALPVDAKTLHRLLGVTRGRTGTRHRAQPLPYDVVVVDEASMLDLALAARLADALAADACLILLGDRDQLAAVEAGRVFGALCQAASASAPPAPSTSLTAVASSRRKAPDEQAAFAFPPMMVAKASALSAAFVELRGNHRFGAHSAIGRLASALRAGRADMALQILDAGGDEARRIDVGASALPQRIVHELVPRYASLAQASDANAAFAIADRFRVLCALRETAFGAVAINAAIEYELRRRSDRVDEHGWYAGRLVIVGGNDYRLGLFNGDIGVALRSGAGGALEVWFRNADGSLRVLPPLVLGSVDAAYALTVHKAQGSEFDEVTVVLPDRDARVLTRELVYTAITRARKKAELWTSGEVLTQAIARSTQRWSGLADAVGSAASRMGP